MVKRLTDFFQIENHHLCIIDCFADWCGPCKKLTPFFEELSLQYEGVQFLKCNVDETDILQERYDDITELPTILFLVDGEENSRLIGFNPERLEKSIEQFIKLNKKRNI